MMVKNILSPVALLSVLAVVLVGCNGQEDFSDAKIGGPTKGYTSPNPPNEAQAHLSVELVVGAMDGSAGPIPAIVEGLNYECGDIRAAALKDGKALCWTVAKKVRFWLGELNPEPGTARAPELTIGTFYFPEVTGRRTFTDANGQQIEGAGEYQASLAELIPGLASGGESRQAPAAVSSSDLRVSNRQALLYALNADAQLNKLVMPAFTREQMLSLPVTGESDQNVSFESPYNDFKGVWSDWVDGLGNTAGLTTLTSAQAQQMAQAATARARTGMYQFNYNYQLALLAGGDAANLELSFMVLPNGQSQGIGRLMVVPGLNEDAFKNIEDLQDLNAYKVRQIPVYLKASAGHSLQLDDTLRLVSEGGPDWWTAKAVLQKDNVDMGFKGRIIGSLLYDNETRSADGGNKTDFQLDYVSSPYKPVATDKGQFWAQGKAAIGTAEEADIRLGNQDDPQPIRAERMQRVSAYLAADHMQQVPEHYRITRYQACVPPDTTEPSCDPIPPRELEENYGRYYVLGGEGCDRDNPVSTGCVFHQIQTHRPVASMDIRIDRANGLLEVLDENCQATGRHVGMLTRTVEDGGGLGAILNVLVVGEEADNIADLGVEIQGRIHLDGQKSPFYRLSEDMVRREVSAYWVDYFSAADYWDAEDLADIPRNDQTNVPSSTADQHKLYRYFSMSGGSAKGMPLDANCDPEL